MGGGGAWSSKARPCAATFARHETFHPRYGWLKKGVDLVDHDPVAFASDDVHMNLGVGKNMAHAIRYWCEAFGLVEPGGSTALTDRQARRSLSEVEGRRAHQLTHTARDLIAGATAFDPYVESTGTLWWLHYNLIKTQKATTWNFVIDHFGRPSFTAEQMLEDLKKFVQVEYPDHKVAESSLAKDVQLFLRMYAYDEKASFHEDSIDSPFVELGLLNKRGEIYSFVTGAKPTLSDAVIAAAILDYASSRSLRPSSVSRFESAVEAPGTGSKSISFTELMNADGSPVKAFRLTENDLYEALERVLTPQPPLLKERGRSAAARTERSRSEGVRPDLFISDTAGVKQLSWHADPKKLVHKLLKGYYRHALH